MSLVLAVTPAEAKEVDLTARDVLDQLREDLSRRGIVFAMARLNRIFVVRSPLRGIAGQDRGGPGLHDPAHRARGIQQALSTSAGRPLLRLTMRTGCTRRSQTMQPAAELFLVDAVCGRGQLSALGCETPCLT